MAGFSTDAILLKKIEYGDHDLIMTFLTDSEGKICVIAKNAKKSVKRFSGALDLFSVHNIQCRLPQKNKGAMIILSQAELEKGFINIRSDVFKTGYAGYWTEMVNTFLEEGKAQPKLYELLLFSLDALDSGFIEKEVISLLFQIRFMSISGFSPNIEHCGICKKSIDNIKQKHIRFDFKDGRIICADCLSDASRFGMDVTKGTLKQLFWINTTDIKRAARIRFSKSAMKEGQILLESFIPFHMGTDFKSLAFLRRLRQER
ncbi:MAG: DNA repair protein RecO [Desulfobacteraceae bacterium]|nr:DNA repair protein RecO [Desulfobacteraceae bacterium]